MCNEKIKSIIKFAGRFTDNCGYNGCTLAFGDYTNPKTNHNDPLGFFLSKIDGVFEFKRLLPDYKINQGYLRAKAICPFHSETQGSLVMFYNKLVCDPEGVFYPFSNMPLYSGSNITVFKCYGCGWGSGTIIDFEAMLLEKKPMDVLIEYLHRYEKLL